MSFSSSLLPEHRSLGIWRWRVWGGFKKLFVRPSDGFGALSKHSTESKRYSPPLNPPLEMNYICSNWKLFFFPPTSLFSCYFSEGQCPWVSLCLSSWVFLIISPLPSRLSSHVFFSVFEFCRTLQTVGPSHARTYTVAVYFKGERIGCGKGPRWATQQHTRRDEALLFLMGLENNGCALLMVFIIAIKLLLAHSVGRDIMQNENESIHYWFDVNCVMEISLCAAEKSRHLRAALTWDVFSLSVCVWGFFFLCVCRVRSHIHAFCKVKKVNLGERAFSGLEGLTIKLQLSLREMKPKSIKHHPPSSPSPHVEIPSTAPSTWKRSLLL